MLYHYSTIFASLCEEQNQTCLQKKKYRTLNYSCRAWFFSLLCEERLNVLMLPAGLLSSRGAMVSNMYFQIQWCRIKAGTASDGWGRKWIACLLIITSLPVELRYDIFVETPAVAFVSVDRTQWLTCKQESQLLMQQSGIPAPYPQFLWWWTWDLKK